MADLDQRDTVPVPWHIWELDPFDGPNLMNMVTTMAYWWYEGQSFDYLEPHDFYVLYCVGCRRFINTERDAYYRHLSLRTHRRAADFVTQLEETLSCGRTGVQSACSGI
jgi:hypothetical protein